LSTFPAFIKQNVCAVFSGKFDAFTNIEFGHGGVGVYSAFWVKVDSTNVYLNTYSTQQTTSDPIPHGLSVEDYITCCLCSKGDNMTLTITTGGGTFAHDLGKISACGTVFAKVGQEMSSVILSASCKDLDKPIWLIGDSYFGITDQRVIGQLQNMGYTNYLVIGQPGINTSGAIADVRKALEFGTPKILVWYVGLNDMGNATTYDGTFKQIKSICESKGITLVLNKVPSILTSEQSAVQDYIVNTGLRYIDSNAAVGASAQGWYPGMLSSDGAHPTAKGALALATQILVDVPEILSVGV
jgi:hypothetical protein